VLLLQAGVTFSMAAVYILVILPPMPILPSSIIPTSHFPHQRPIMSRFPVIPSEEFDSSQQLVEAGVQTVFAKVPQLDYKDATGKFYGPYSSILYVSALRHGQTDSVAENLLAATPPN